MNGPFFDLEARIVGAVIKKIESQVQFWSLLGPFFVLLSITALLLKASAHWYFPFSALIGIPLCVKWGVKGMVGALGSLLILVCISFHGLELDERYWHVGLTVAMAFSFVVLTLSLEEAQGLVGKLQVESQSRLDNFLFLDERWKEAALEWEKSKERMQSEIEALTAEGAKVLEEKQAFYKLTQLAKDELIQIRKKYDALLQELIYKKQHIAQLQERIEESEGTIQKLVNSEWEKKSEALLEQVNLVERDRENLKSQIALMKEEREKAFHQREQELAAPHDLALYQQLKEQFKEKSQTLEETRKALFEINEERLLLLKEFEEQKRYAFSPSEELFQSQVMELQKQLEQAEKDYQEEVDALMRLVASLMESNLNQVGAAPRSEFG